MKEFTKTARQKGWTLKEIGERWGVKPRQMSVISTRPKPVHWDALKGLPVRCDV